MSEPGGEGKIIVKKWSEKKKVNFFFSIEKIWSVEMFLVNFFFLDRKNVGRFFFVDFFFSMQKFRISLVYVI